MAAKALDGLASAFESLFGGGSAKVADPRPEPDADPDEGRAGTARPCSCSAPAEPEPAPPAPEPASARTSHADRVKAFVEAERQERAARRQELLRDYGREVPQETERDAAIERDQHNPRPRARRARTLGHPRRGAPRTAKASSPKEAPDAKATPTPETDARAQQRRETDRWCACRRFVYQFSLIAKPKPKPPPSLREEAAGAARRRRRMAAADVATDADHGAEARACRRQASAATGRAHSAASGAAGQGVCRAGACGGRRGRRRMAGANDARAAMLPDAAGAKRLGGEMGQVSKRAGASAKAGSAGATKRRRQGSWRRDEAVVRGMPSSLLASSQPHSARELKFVDPGTSPVPRSISFRMVRGSRASIRPTRQRRSIVCWP